MAASSSARACCFSVSSMKSAPFGWLSSRVDAAALPNDDEVDDRAPITLATFFCALYELQKPLIHTFIMGQTKYNFNVNR